MAEEGPGVVPLLGWYTGSERPGHFSSSSDILAERKGYVLTDVLVVQAALGGRCAVVSSVFVVVKAVSRSLGFVTSVIFVTTVVVATGKGDIRITVRRKRRPYISVASTVLRLTVVAHALVPKTVGVTNIPEVT